MAAEVVGTAYVAVRALTNKIASDIRDGLDKGVAGAGGEEAGRDLGDDIGKGASEGAGERMRADLPGEIDKTSKDRDVTRSSHRAGKSISQRFAEGFKDDDTFANRAGKHISDTLKKISLPGGAISWAILLGLPALGGAAKAITATLSTIVAQLSFIGTAAAGAGIGLGGLIAALGLGAIPIVFAFKAETDELAAFKDVLSDFGELWTEVGEVTQKTLLPGLVAAVHALEPLAALFKFVGPGFGQIVGDMAEAAAKALTSDENMKLLADTMVQVDKIWRSFSDAFVAIVGAMPALLATITPIAAQLADSIATAAEKLADLIQTGAADGSLQEKFQKWYDRAKLLADIIGDVLVGLGNILGIAADTSEDSFKGLADMTQRFRDWTDSFKGQNAIKEFFENARPVAHEVFGILGDILKMIGKPLATGDTDNLVGFLQKVREDLLPALGTLAGIVVDISSGALAGFVDELITFVQILADNPELAGNVFGLLATNLTIFTKALGFFNDILQTDMGPKILNLVLPFVILAKVLASFGLLKPLFSLGSAIVGLIGLGPAALVIIALAGAIALFVVVWKNWDQIEGFIKRFPALAIAFGAAIALMFGPIGVAALAIVGLVAAIKHWDDIIKFFRELPDKLRGFINQIPEILQGLVDSFAELPGKLPAILAGALAGFQEFGIGIGEAILNGISNLGPTIRTGLDTLVDLVIEGLKKLPKAILNLSTDMLDAATSWAKEFGPDIAKFLGKAVGTILGFFLKLPFTLLALNVRILSAAVGWALQLPGVLVRLIGLAGQALARAMITIVAFVGSSLVDFFFALPSILGNGISGLVDFIVSFFLALPGRILAANQLIGQFLLSVFEAAIPLVLSGVNALVDEILAAFGRLPEQIGAAFSSFASAIVDVVEDAIPLVLDALTRLIEFAVTTFARLPIDLIEAIAAFPGQLSSFLSASWNVAKAGLESLIASIVEFIGKLPARAISALSSFGSTLSSFFNSAWSVVRTGVGQLVQSILDFLGKLPAKVVDALVDFGSTLSSFFSGTWNTIKAGVTMVFNNIVSFFTGLPGKVKDGIEDNVDQLESVGRAMVNAILRGITAIGSQIKAKILSFIPTPGDILSKIPGGGAVSAVKGFLSSAAPAGITGGLAAAAATVSGAAGVDSRNMSRSTSVGSLLHIENAKFESPSDADLVASKVLTALQMVGS